MGHLQKEEDLVDQAIPIRHPHLDFERDIPPHYFRDNAFFSHFMTSYNFTFPDGEQFFVESVKFFKDRITDPRLSSEVKNFCGQEYQHRKQHILFIGYIEKLGYQIKSWMKWLNSFLRKFLPKMSPGFQLAFTAGTEHLTATIAHGALKNHMLDKADPTMRRLWLWHSIEEMEHKHVAFDVFQTVYPNNYFLRIRGYLFALLMGFSCVFYGMFRLLREDFRLGQLDFKKLKDHSKIFMYDRGFQNFLKYLFMTFPVYFKPSFHPKQILDQDVIDFYSPELRQFS